jgi:hypothetical protein
MSTVTESNINFDLTGKEYFRFADCLGYRTLSGYGFKEMDLGWLEPATSTKSAKLYVVELKDFSRETLIGRKQHQYPNYAAKADFIIEELVRKSIDSMAMLAAVIIPTGYAPQLQPCLPPSYQPGGPVQFIHIMHLSPSLIPYLSFINTKVQNRFTAYQRLFDLVNITHCTVISHTQATQLFPFIT